MMVDVRDVAQYASLRVGDSRYSRSGSRIYRVDRAGEMSPASPAECSIVFPSTVTSRLVISLLTENLSRDKLASAQIGRRAPMRSPRNRSTRREPIGLGVARSVAD